MSLGLILAIILIIFLLGGFSGRFGGYRYGYGHGGVGVIGIILIIVVVLVLFDPTGCTSRAAHHFRFAERFSWLNADLSTLHDRH